LQQFLVWGCEFEFQDWLLTKGSLVAMVLLVHYTTANPSVRLKESGEEGEEAGMYPLCIHHK